MEDFKRRIDAHVEHVKKVGDHCGTEETTKQALILPLLDILGFSPYDPTKVKAEYGADFPGVKATERVDYALFSAGLPVLFIEAKAQSQELTNHCPQLSRYYNATPEVAVAAITNGREWRFFTDLLWIGIRSSPSISTHPIPILPSNCTAFTTTAWSRMHCVPWPKRTSTCRRSERSLPHH